jgi:vancomycin resistance protein VanJ
VSSTATRRTASRAGSGGSQARYAGVLISLLAVLLTAALAGHRAVPGGAGVLLDTALPWLGLGVPLLAAAAVVRQAWPSLAVLLLPALVWAGMFGTAFVGGGGGDYDLRAVSQNLYAANLDPERTVTRLIQTRADVLALQELDSGDYPRNLDRAYPHHAVRGTVGLWSRWPISSVQPINLGMGWTRALRAELATPKGALTVYVAHLGSARPGATRGRDATLERLARAVRADPAKRLMILGDLNTAATDRELNRLAPPLHEAQRAAGKGFGFSWPSQLPVTRPDHILYRGIEAVDAAALSTPGTDHRAVLADFSL